MLATVTFGPATLHVVSAVPGRANEVRRLAETVAEARPLAIAFEADAAHALALRERLAGGRGATPFHLSLAAGEVARRHEGAAEDPFLAVARHAKSAEIPLVPLLPAPARVGYFERRRLRRVAAAAPTGAEEAATARAVEDALRAAEPRLAGERAAEEKEAARRLARLLFEDERTRVAAVLTPARGSAIVAALRALAPARPRDLEAPRPPTATGVTTDAAYPRYR